MTVPNEISKAGPYLGNGVTKAFGFGFLVISASHVRVVKTFADGAYADLVFGADYLVSGAGNPAGGNVTLDVAPATGETITILRDMPFTQETDLENQGAFHAQTIEDALDLSVMRDQILFDRLRNSIHVPDTETADMELPSAVQRANKYMLFDANGEPTYVNSQIDARYYGSASVDPALRPDGSPRQASDLYFNTALLRFRVFTGAVWVDALPTANLTLVNYREVSATAKTTFNIAGGYQPSAVFVYLNGVLLDTSEYTASNGTTVVLASACAINDELRCVSFSNFSVADTLARSNNLSDLPSASAALTNLGFTALAKTLAAVLDAASYRAAIGALGVGGVSFGDITGAVLGVVGTSVDDGTILTGTYTPDPLAASPANFRRLLNGGAFTLAAPTRAGPYTMVITLTNGAGAGAVTLSGFTKVSGDALTTTNGHKFFIFITKDEGLVSAVVQALQ